MHGNMIKLRDRLTISGTTPIFPFVKCDGFDFETLQSRSTQEILQEMNPVDLSCLMFREKQRQNSNDFRGYRIQRFYIDTCGSTAEVNMVIAKPLVIVTHVKDKQNFTVHTYVFRIA
jgi:hypothetical protein